MDPTSSQRRSPTPPACQSSKVEVYLVSYTFFFSNDLALCAEEGVTIVQYADDCQILVTGKKRDLPLLISRMEKALNSLLQWFCRNKIKLNASKTQMMVLGTPQMLRTLPAITIDFCGSEIPDSRVLKNLGITFDRHLSFEAHVYLNWYFR